jgi:hypothetical protein
VAPGAILRSRDWQRSRLLNSRRVPLAACCQCDCSQDPARSTGGRAASGTRRLPIPKPILARSEPSSHPPKQMIRPREPWTRPRNILTGPRESWTSPRKLLTGQRKPLTGLWKLLTGPREQKTASQNSPIACQCQKTRFSRSWRPIVTQGLWHSPCEADDGNARNRRGPHGNRSAMNESR